VTTVLHVLPGLYKKIQCLVGGEEMIGQGYSKKHMTVDAENGFFYWS